MFRPGLAGDSTEMAALGGCRGEDCMDVCRSACALSPPPLSTKKTESCHARDILRIFWAPNLKS